MVATESRESPSAKVPKTRWPWSKRSWRAWEALSKPDLKRCPLEEEGFLRQRWLAPLKSAYRSAWMTTVGYYLTRAVAVLGGVAVATLATLGATTSNGHPTALAWWVFAIGLAIAGATSLEQLGRFGEKRVLARRLREDLVTEGCHYFYQVDPYGKVDWQPGGQMPENRCADYRRFKERIEAILQAFFKGYWLTIEPPSSGQTPGGQSS
jgi:hypothetical protein